MRRTLTLLFSLTILATIADAAFLSEEVDEGIYFVSYERGKMTRGGVLDTSKKARRKLENRSHEFCLEEGFKYLKFPTIGEISRDENLRMIWSIAAGDDSKDSSSMSGDLWSGTTSTHKSRDLLLLAHEEQDGFEKCVKR
ncbi:MAG: hypothetical protein WBP10_05860 [Thermoanaerobaculia bacterium]|jgi:hypothetical protein